MRKLLAIMIALSLFVVAGCTPAQEDEYAQGVTDTTIKIGNAADTNGTYSFIGGPFNHGLKAYLKRINDAGGVDGRTIEFVEKPSDFFNVPAGIAAVEELVEDEKIFALVGHFGSFTVAATLPYIREQGIPMVYAATGIADLFREKAVNDERVVFPVQPVYQTEGQWMVAKVKEVFPNATKIGVFYTDDEAGQNLRWGVVQQARALGLTVVSQQTPLTGTNITPASQVTAMKAANVDVVIAAMNQGPFIQLATELATQNVGKPLFTSYVSSNVTVTTALKGPTGPVGTKFDIYAGAWVDITGDNAANYTQFVNDMTAYGQAALATNAFAMAGWIAAHYFVEGLDRVEGVVTWEKFITAMESAPIKNPLGGTIDYSDGKRWGTMEMSLLKADPTQALGWIQELPLSGITG
ncbi:MAG TPA: ABC transporter substrate-binding protein [Bacilli bacterium]|mgnify:CR=1 FL=1|nr:ABC transporter substrate-binding protein [Bacilli bacterium]